MVQPCPCTAIYFTTQGASKSVAARVRVPKIVKMVPENGADNVKPSVKVLRVTFDVPMGAGMSWTGGGEQFPDTPEGEVAKWSGDGKTCLLPVSLQAGKSYRLGINSPSHINFQSKWGVPVVPVEYRFTTSGGSAADKNAESPTPEHMQAMVEDFFKHNFRDVTQHKTIEWGEVETDTKGHRSIRYKYYASIWDKQLLVMNQVFTFDANDEYIGYINVEGFPETLSGETSIPADE